MRWWEAWPGRLEYELDAFRRRGLVFQLDQNEYSNGRIVLRGNLDVPPSRTVGLVVIYPDTFPHTRFSVFAPTLDLERHQHPMGKNLCVFPRGSDHWRPSFVAADVIAERVPRLIKVVEQGGDVRAEEDPQGEPFSDYYPYLSLGGVYTPADAFGLKPDVESGHFEALFSGTKNWLTELDAAETTGTCNARLSLLVDRVVASNGELLAEAGDELRGRFQDAKRWRGRWVRLRQPLRVFDATFVEQLGQLRPEVSKRRFSNGPNKNIELVAAVYPEEVEQGVYQDAWLFALVIGTPAAYKTAFLRTLRAGEEYFSERIPHAKALRPKTVALAGLGAIGSSIALELARSQLGAMSVLDSDYVELGTTVRWLLGFPAAGRPKVLAVRDFITEHFPYTTVRPFEHHVGGTSLIRDPEDEWEVLDAWAEGADLMVDATAESNVTSVLNGLSVRRRVPLIAVWSIDAHGGIASRFVPGSSGCGHCLDLALSPDGGTIPAPRPATSGNRIQPTGCADPTFMGASIDLVPLALEAARFAIGELSLEQEGAYPRPPYDVITWQLRESDGSILATPEWRTYQLPPNDQCPLCHPNAN